MADPFWTPERREVLRGAIRKTQAGAEQRELVKVTGDEAFSLYKAAEAWADMMDMLDERARAGKLKGMNQ
jgi:hypothetical protein